MKSKLFFLAVSAAALVTSCSNDELTEINTGDAIDFNVTAGAVSRATATTTSSIDEFKVWAFTNGQVYMPGMEVNGGNGSWTYEGIKYWPETDVDFFAVSPMVPNGTVSVALGSKTIADYIANGDEDLLYSVNLGEKKEDHKTAPVAVNFRHALSQIAFQVKKTDGAPINVEIKDITIEGVANKATYTWASNTTAAVSGDTEVDASWGTWSTPTGNASYKIALDNTLEVEPTAATLGDSRFLMPQTLNPWLVKDGESYKVSGTARILVNCRIVDRNSGVQIWPKDTDANIKEFSNVAISLTNPTNDPFRTLAEGSAVDPQHDRWMQGKKYIYTLIFGKGAGFTPDPENPEPVLVPITFTVTVDDFQEGGKHDVEM